MVKKIIKKEEWYKSRRAWSSIFATLASALILFIEIPYIDKIVAACGIIAASLGGYSYVKPKSESK